jgi:hypothetical protein
MRTLKLEIVAGAIHCIPTTVAAPRCAFLGSRKFGLQPVCRLFPSYKGGLSLVYAGGGYTYHVPNVEALAEQYSAWVVDTCNKKLLIPWLHTTVWERFLAQFD